jgi:hypothetical protein
MAQLYQVSYFLPVTAVRFTGTVTRETIAKELGGDTTRTVGAVSAELTVIADRRQEMARPQRGRTTRAADRDHA